MGLIFNSNIIETILPHCNNYWAEINELRNQKTEAHPYDKFGNIRIKITKEELHKLYQKEIRAIEELCDFKDY